MEQRRWYPLEGGVGFGKIKVGLLFQPTNLTLPNNLLGNQVGTLVMDSLHIVSNLPTKAKEQYYLQSQLELSPHHPQCSQHHHDLNWERQQFLFPLTNRHQNAISITLKQRTLLGTDRVLGKGSLPLCHLVDGSVEGERMVTLVSNKDSATILPKGSFRIAPLASGLDNLILGLRVGFFPGFSYAHQYIFASTMPGLDPKYIVAESNLLWSQTRTQQHYSDIRER